MDARINAIKDKYVIAKDAGDVIGIMKAEREMDAMRIRHPELVNADTLDRSYEATLNYRKRVINGVAPDIKVDNPYLEQLLLLD